MIQEDIEKRIAALRDGAVQTVALIQHLEQQLETAKSNLTATHGAIQENQRWLDQSDVKKTS